MVFSKSLLRIFAPHLKKCLENLLTEHEDIELGRCVSKMSGVKCTTSWETRKLFYQNFKNGTYAHNILDPVEENIGKFIALIRATAFFIQARMEIQNLNFVCKMVKKTYYFLCLKLFKKIV